MHNKDHKDFPKADGDNMATAGPADPEHTKGAGDKHFEQDSTNAVDHPSGDGQ